MRTKTLCAWILVIVGVLCVRAVQSVKKSEAQASNPAADSSNRGADHDMNEVLSAIGRRQAMYPPTPAVDPNGHAGFAAKAAVRRDDDSKVSKEITLRRQESEQLGRLDSELHDLDKYVTQERQRIEAWYAESLVRVRQWAQQRNKELDNAEKAAYARCLQRLRSTESVTNRRIQADGYASGSGYVTPNGYIYGTGQATVQGYSSEQTQTRVVGDPAGEYNQILSQVRETRQAIGQEFVRLEQMKKDYLATLDAEQERKRRTLNWHKGQVQRDTARQLSPGPDLIVEAVGAGTGNRLYAMVNDKLVYEGNVVNGYTVRRILANSVEFEKDGKVVVQKME